MLEKIFLQILNMSFTASFVIIFVLIARLLLKKSPKILSYALWGVVLFRLICPFSFESVFSLLPAKANPISQDIIYEAVPAIDTGIPAISHAMNSSLPAATPAASVNPLQIWVFIGTMVWLLGIAALLIYSIISLVKLQKRLRQAVYERDNIYLAEHLDTPFVMGIVRPKIYLPTSLTEKEKRYILLHEETHIRRHDHVIKILSFFVLCLHWFNPFVWIAFFVSGRDMEMACDEAVIKQLGNGVKKEYSSSLLKLATNKRIIGGSPLAFGEGDTKGRIKNVLNYKKPAFWVVAFSFIIVVVLGIGFATNQKAERSFEMSGNYLSDLQPEEIVKNIAKIIKVDTGDIDISPDNFGLTVSSDFKWVNDEAIRILYPKNGKPWNASQLRIFVDEPTFFVTEPSDWVTYDGQIFLLQYYLEALKYLPQEEIASLSKESPQRYAIELSKNDRKLNADRSIYYNKSGVTENNGRHIRLDIQPLYGDNSSSLTGVGNDIIHVFYSSNNSTDTIPVPSEMSDSSYSIIKLGSAEELWKARTKYIGDNSAVGKIISLLQFPEGVAYDGFELHTSEQPYAVTVKFKTDTEIRNYYSGADNQSLFQINALIMFSLIENAESITFSLNDGIYDPYSIQYTADMAKMILGDNYRKGSETLDGFHSQIEKLRELLPINRAETVSAQYSSARIRKDGEIIAYSLMDNQLAEAIIMDFMAKSAVWEGIDISTLEESYLIRQTFPQTNETHDYYAYLLDDGKAFLQSGVSGVYGSLSHKLYSQLVESFKDLTIDSQPAN